MRNYILLVLFSVMITPVFGTTFIPVPIKKQIVESEGIVKGEVITVNSEEDNSGRIITRLFLRADKWMGIQPESGHIEIFYPGGQIGDKVQMVHGAPKFKEGEKVVLLLKNNNKNYWVQNLALGKFMIKKYGTSDVLINSVFPNHPKVGQIPLENFYDLAQTIKKNKFKERFKDKYEIQTEKYAYQNIGKSSRSIASVGEVEQVSDKGFSTFWLLALLGIFGGLFTFTRRREDNR